MRKKPINGKEMVDGALYRIKNEWGNEGKYVFMLYYKIAENDERFIDEELEKIKDYSGIPVENERDYQEIAGKHLSEVEIIAMLDSLKKNGEMPKGKLEDIRFDHSIY